MSRVLSLIKIELYRLYKLKILLILIAIELFSIAITYLNSSDAFFAFNDIYKSTYYNISLMLRYLSVAIVISEAFSKDIKYGIFNTLIATGYKRIELLISKIITSVILVTISQLVGDIIYSMIISENMVINILIYNTINVFPLVSFILVTVFIDILWVSPSITFVVTFILVVFSQMLPYNIAKYILLSYSNAILLFKHGTIEDIITMGIVIASYTVIFAFLDFYLINKIDL